jgi:hypothetical protein
MWSFSFVELRLLRLLSGFHLNSDTLLQRRTAANRAKLLAQTLVQSLLRSQMEITLGGRSCIQLEKEHSAPCILVSPTQGNSWLSNRCSIRSRGLQTFSFISSRLLHVVLLEQAMLHFHVLPMFL